MPKMKTHKGTKKVLNVRKSGTIAISHQGVLHNTGKQSAKRSKQKKFVIQKYLWSFAVKGNREMKQLYNYLKTREKNPLKKMQALVVVSKKILTLIFTLSKKKVSYNPEQVFGSVRKEQLQAA